MPALRFPLRTSYVAKCKDCDFFLNEPNTLPADQIPAVESHVHVTGHTVHYNETYMGYYYPADRSREE
jgi:hypothetical protein